MDKSITTLWYRRVELLKRMVDIEAERDIPDQTPPLPEYTEEKVKWSKTALAAFKKEIKGLVNI